MVSLYVTIPKKIQALPNKFGNACIVTLKEESNGVFTTNRHVVHIDENALLCSKLREPTLLDDIYAASLIYASGASIDNYSIPDDVRQRIIERVDHVMRNINEYNRISD
jgi:hypothetical protein